LDTNFLAEIHTKVVHFPIALLATYSILEIVGVLFKNHFVSKSALLILCFGVVTSLFAVLTGNQAATSFLFWNDESNALLSNHQTFATILLWFSAIICGLRTFAVIKKKFTGLTKYIFVLSAILILFLVFKTGTYGGDLVKKYGIGTDVHQNNELK